MKHSHNKHIEVKQKQSRTNFKHDVHKTKPKQTMTFLSTFSNPTDGAIWWL